MNQRLACVILEFGGHEVMVAERADLGLEMARIKQPELVLMDMQLPGMDGLTATRRLKEDPATARIPVIAITAFAMLGDKERILAAGCDAYLAKPFDYEGLLDTIDGVLGDRPDVPARQPLQPR